MKRNLVLILIAMFCLFNAWSQQQINKGFRQFDDITYYHGIDFDSANHKLNLVIPIGTDEPALLVWIGGGSWSYVDRNVEMNLAQKFAESGIAVASIGHRLSVATWQDTTLNVGLQHPEHIKDIARAVQFLYQNASKYGYTNEKIFVGGFSAGAHLAALLAMDGRYLENQGLTVNMIKGVIPISGTFDIAHYHKTLVEANGKEFADNHIGSVFGLSSQAFVDASPTSFMYGYQTPMLLMSDRNMVPYHLVFEELLREQNFHKLQVINLHNFSHGELWRHLSNQQESQYRNLIVQFVRDHENEQIP